MDTPKGKENKDVKDWQLLIIRLLWACNHEVWSWDVVSIYILFAYRKYLKNQSQEQKSRNYQEN